MRSRITNPLRWLSITALLAASAITGCAPPSQVTPLASTPATVTVHNQQSSDVKIYLLAGSAEHKLGSVNSMSSATFRIPGVLPTPSELSFRAVPVVSGETQSTDRITLWPGSDLVFTVGQGAATSSLLRRR